MCGIAGLIDPRVAPETRTEAVERMVARMRHRGPDDGAVMNSGPATLGMRRLAIFDPAHGRQPMSTADGRHTIVFNGAIYNFCSLRERLETHGFSFRTDCDTEVLLAAYAHWGADCVRHLRGMFAFAVWDAREQTLFLARDPFGIKPLYFRSLPDGQLLFASELNALVASRAFPVAFDPLAISAYLTCLGVPAPRTIYRGVSSLRPGETALWRDGRLTLAPGWTFRDCPQNVPVCASPAEFDEQLRVRLDDTIAAHSVADVPVGAFLSGGLDSAAVVGLMAQRSATRLRTFSIGFDEPGFSEAAAAAATAHHYGTEHHASVLRGADVARDFERIVASFDQPSGDGVNTFYASQAARAGGMTVVLSGLGGDELFGGYPSFRDVPRLAPWLRAKACLPAALRERLAARLDRGSTRAQKLADILRHATDVHSLAALQRRLFADTAASRLLTAPSVAAPYPELAHLPAELAGAGLFEIVSAWELRNYTANLLLRDSDAMSMRHSIELRVPFLDRPLIEWLWRQPARFKSTPRQPKAALARALRDVLPPDVMRRPKNGFSLPFPLWMRGPLRPQLDELFSAASIERTGFIAPAPAQRLWQNFLASDDRRAWSRVWSLAILIAFLNRRPAA